MRGDEEEGSDENEENSEKQTNKQLAAIAETYKEENVTGLGKKGIFGMKFMQSHLQEIAADAKNRDDFQEEEDQHLKKSHTEDNIEDDNNNDNNNDNNRATFAELLRAGAAAPKSTVIREFI
jgi:hypothetical protein